MVKMKKNYLSLGALIPSIVLSATLSFGNPLPEELVKKQEAKVMYTEKKQDALVDLISSQIKEKQIIILGENHKLDKDNQLFMHLMYEFKEKGYQDICLEIDSFFQPLIDDYMAGKIEGRSLIFFQQIYNLLDILQFAKEQKGIQVHCIDERPRYSGEHGGNPSEIGSDRNKKMYENIEKRIFNEKSDAKTLIFVGAWHANKKPIPSLLKKHFENDDSIQNTLTYYLEQNKKGKNYSIFLIKKTNFPEAKEAHIKDFDLIAFY